MIVYIGIPVTEIKLIQVQAWGFGVRVSGIEGIRV